MSAGPSPFVPPAQPGPPTPPGPPMPPAPPAKGSRAAGAVLTVSTVLVGLMAGLFFAFDVSVMPGLAAGDEQTYVTAMRAFNKAIDGNPLFGTVFLLALVAAVLSAVLEFRGGRRAVALWVGAAAAAYLVVLLITFTVNIPLNDELADAGDVAGMQDFGIVERFRTTWVTTNIIRTLLCTTALAALARALLLHGRTTR
ncbi:anthrone oxygenase family protein [Streptomyces erythrochromogenes]|uniref:anthrone oxygenase family protein n=1 Tax=Streptomyces erythrochromogenes TaxID=285574 RepID=UPI0036A03A4F